MHKAQHPHVGVVRACAGVCAFDPSLGVGWRKILSWYLVEWTMEMVVDPGEAQQEFPGTGDARRPNWHWDPGGTTYHFPCIPVDDDLEGIVDLAVEHAHSLGESRSTPVADQFMDKLFWFSWYGICTRDHWVISILWQEFVGGGGISRPPNDALHGAGALHFCAGHKRHRGAEQWWHHC